MRSVDLASLLSFLFLAPAWTSHAVVESETGWAELGKTCFGYHPDGAGRVGRIDMFLEAPVPYPEGLVVLLYSSEAGSYPSLTDDMTCEEKETKAKDYKDLAQYFTVNFNNPNHPGTWYMPHIPIGGHKVPRMWYMVLVNCKNFTGVKYDLRFQHTAGVYPQGTGPSRCEPDWSIYDEEVYSDGGATAMIDMIVLLVIMALLSLVLAFFLHKQCQKTKQIQQGSHSVPMDEFRDSSGDVSTGGDTKKLIVGRRQSDHDEFENSAEL